MANKVLRTLSLGSESMDIPDAGDYMEMTDNKIGLKIKGANRIDTTKTVNLSHNTQLNVSVADVTITGMYFVTWRVEFPANTSGARYAVVSLEKNDGTYVTAFSGSRTAPAPSGATILNGGQVIDLDATTYKNIGLRIFQNSGSSMTGVIVRVSGNFIEK